MKKLLFILFLIFLPCMGYAQNGFLCGTVTDDEQQTLMKVTAVSDTGGKYITSEGTITAMIIFARFSDDNETTTLWPNASQLPLWAELLLNQNYSATGVYSLNSFTDYIYENSYGKLHIIGDVFYITLPQTENYYYTYSPSADTIRKKIEQDAFDQLPIQYSSINLSKYDNWKNLKSGEEFNTEQIPDNIVDMCWFIMRNFHDDNYSVKLYRGEAMLYASKTIGGITIKNGYPGAAFGSLFNQRGSGISMFQADWIDDMIPRQTIIHGRVSEVDNDGSHHTIMGVMMHELSHYFFGFNHFGDRNINGFSTKRSNSDVIHASNNPTGVTGNILGYEKIRLGWISPSEINIVTSNQTFTLLDLSSFQSGYKIVKILLDSEQSIYLENRTWVSPYEIKYVPDNRGKMLNPGILAYLVPVENNNLSSTPINQICADGKWDWVRLSGSGLQSPDDIIDKLQPNSFSGYDEKEYIYMDEHPSGRWLAGYWWQDFGTYWGPWYKGDNFINENQISGDFLGDDKDFFGVGEVISKWSNGATHKRISVSSSHLAATDVGVEIKSYNATNSSFTIEVRVNQPELLSPSKPQNVKSSLNSSNKITTTWAENLEPDINAYKIYRELYYGSTTISETHIQNLTTESYADDLTLPASLPNGVDLYVRYKVEAKDNTNKLSVKAVGNPIYLGRTFTGNYSGTINQNYVFFGNVIINSATAVNNNSVLWIAPNTSVSFYNNHSLTALPGSRIIAKGTSSQPITFRAMTTTIPGTWNSVTLYSSNNIFRYCIFKYAVYGLYLYNASPGQNYIENCSFFSNSQNGIRLYHSNAHVKNSNIYSNNSYGIYCNNSSNLILNGTRINNNGNTGLYSLLNNYISLYGTVIENNTGNGINSDYSDNIYVGSITGDWGGYNTVRYNSSTEIYVGYNNPNNFEIMFSSIHDNSGLEMYNFTTPEIYVYSSYWDNNGCQYVGYVTFYGTQYSSLPTWDGQVSSTGMFGKIAAAETADNIEWFFDPKISKPEKIRKCKEIVERSPESDEGKIALHWLYKLMREDYEEDQLKEKENFFEYLNYLQGRFSNTETEKEVLKSMVMWQRLENNKEAAIQILNKMQKQYGNDEERWALTNLAFIYAHSGNVSEAKNLLKKLEKNYPDQAEIYEQLKIDIKDVENWITLGTFQDKSINKSIEINEIPEEVALIQNYPNPFNPITQIKYQIPEDGYVTLKVFDILGREVAELVNEEKIAGTYTVNFDGSYLSSGIYFYSITAGAFNQVKKMLLVK